MAMGKLVKFVGRRKKARKARPVATKALRKVIQKVLNKNLELKYIDCGFTGLVTATSQLATGGSTTCSDILPGDDQGQRTGHQIRIKKLELKGSFQANSIYDQDVICYIAIVLYKDPLGNTPGVASIWDNTSNIGNSFRFEDRKEDYTILKMIRVHMPIEFGAAAQDGPVRNFSWTKRFKGAGLRVEYNNAATGAATDVEQNNLFCYVQRYGNPPNAGGTISLANTEMRISFTDA